MKARVCDFVSSFVANSSSLADLELCIGFVLQPCKISFIDSQLTYYLLEALRPVQNVPEKFENGGFTLKTYQMFSFHTTSEEFENATVTGHFIFVFEETSVKDTTCMIIVNLSFPKSSVFKMFSVHTKIKKQAFSMSPGLTSVFEKLRFRNGLVWTLGLNVEIKLRFQISPA